MITQISIWIVALFGIYMCCTSFIILLKPRKAQAILRKFASTNFINYLEITIRMIVGIALIQCTATCKSPEVFSVFGWFLCITALILYAVPRKWHHSFSLKSAELIKPIYFRMISPFAFLFGYFILFNLNLL